MSTNILSAKDIKRSWHLVDVRDKVLGRIAVQISKVLSGKTKTNYVPYLDAGDFVVVINASQIKVTGKKLEQKQYVRHSGFPGGFKSETLSDLLGRTPQEVIRHAVWGMLPKNKLGRQMVKRLRVFPGEQHPYVKQIGQDDKN